MNSNQQRFFYCPKCGHKVVYINDGEKDRLTCIQCGYIIYENPVVGVAAIVINQNMQILLGRRNTGPYKGLWCIPCGYLEYDEDVWEGVKREFKEETNLDICPTRVYTVQSNFHNPEQHSVGIWFEAKVTAGEIKAGDDLDQVDFFSFSQLPDIAFPTDKKVLNYLASDIAKSDISISVKI